MNKVFKTILFSALLVGSVSQAAGNKQAYYKITEVICSSGAQPDESNLELRTGKVFHMDEDGAFPSSQPPVQTEHLKGVLASDNTKAVLFTEPSSGAFRWKSEKSCPEGDQLQIIGHRVYPRKVQHHRRRPVAAPAKAAKPAPAAPAVAAPAKAAVVAPAAAAVVAAAPAKSTGTVR